MALSDSFVAPITSCREAVSAGSLILVGKTYNCSAEPPLFLITITAAAAVGATSLSITRTSVTIDGVAGTLSNHPATWFRKGQVLNIGAQDVVVTDDLALTTSGTLQVRALTAAIAANATFSVWSLYQLQGVTDLPVNIDATDADRQDLDSGIQGQSVKTRVDLNVPITYFSNPLDFSHRRVMSPAAVGTEDIYVMIVKSSKTVAFGRAKVMGLQETGAVNTLITYSATINFQAPWAYTYLTTDTQVNSAAQLADLNAALSASGLATI